MEVVQISLFMSDKCLDSEAALPRLMGNLATHPSHPKNRSSNSKCQSAGSGMSCVETSQPSDGPKVKTQPNLPRLNLFTSEDARKEQEALARIEALPHDASLSSTEFTEYTMTPVARNISSRSNNLELVFTVEPSMFD